MPPSTANPSAFTQSHIAPHAVANAVLALELHVEGPGDGVAKHGAGLLVDAKLGAEPVQHVASDGMQMELAGRCIRPDDLRQRVGQPRPFGGEAEQARVGEEEGAR